MAFPGRALIGCCLFLLAGCVEPGHERRQWEALGRPAFAEIHATNQSTAVRIANEIEAAIERAESVFATDDPASELGRLNREASLGPVRLGERDLYRCIRLAVDYAKASKGTFDPTIGPLRALYAAGSEPTPAEIERAVEKVGWEQVVLEREALAVRFRKPGMALDLSAMVPGYALDVAARNFALPGSRAGLLRLGDFAHAWGHPPDESGWTVEVSDPRDPDRAFARFELSSRALALVAERAGGAGEIVLDPRTGLPAASNVMLAVAVADSGADAGAIAAALLVGGSRRAGALLSKTRRVESVLLVRSEARPYLLASASLQGRFEPAAELLERVGGRVRYLLPPQSLGKH